MLDLHFSNRFEVLTDRLVERLGTPAGTAFDEDIVVVPNAATRRHLMLMLARRHRICANVRFPYLAQWLWTLAGRVDPAVSGRSPFDPGVLTWRALAAFLDPAWIAPHGRLRGYLDGADDRMRFELAGEVASVLSDYVTYRNDWLEAWLRGESVTLASGGEDQAWQAALWRRIAAELGIAGSNPLLDFARRLDLGDPLPAGALPARAHLFCLPDIPRLHLQVLRALGRRIDLHVHALNPCQAYWFDLVDPKRFARLKAAGRLDHHEVGHRLLSAWGRQAQSQLGLLIDELDTEVMDSSFVPAEESSRPVTLLQRLQNAILRLEEPKPGSVALSPEDRSIEFHDCHSRTRELEVLHDRLLSLFARHADLSPGDVLVVTPDLEAAAPLIDAVFGGVPRERALPFRITGLGRSSANPVARAFLALLDLARSRWSASAVQAMLEQAPVAARFGLDPDALERIRGWLESAGIRWGLDAAHRASLGLPASSGHSFEDGLNRLFLGYALPDSVAMPFAGRLPAGTPEGSEAQALGAFWRFVDALSALRSRISEAATPARWAVMLAQALDDFAQADERDPEDFREVRAAIVRFGTEAGSVLGASTVPPDVVQAALVGLLDDPARGGVPSGAVTFAAISSLRAIPYRVVCLLGFDDGAFPGATRPREFDLMRDDRRAGDRQRQADDRSLFLDQVLAARQYLHLSYIGRGVRDNAPRPPSVLVAELLDHLVAQIARSPADEGALRDARRRLVVEQPLQAFAERAFLSEPGSRVRSFNRAFADALNARAVAAAAPGIGLPAGFETADAADDSGRLPEPAAPFFPQPLEPSAQPRTEVSLDELVRFFRNPCRFLLAEGVGIALRGREEELLDDEPFLEDVPARNALSDRLMPRLLEGLDDASLRMLAEAGTEFPCGSMGRFALARTLGEMRHFAQRVREGIALPLRPPHVVSIQVDVDGQLWQVTAALSDLRECGLVRWRDAPAGPFDHLAAWLHQLVLWASPPQGADASVQWVCRDLGIRFERSDESPAQQLADLTTLFVRGLREPIAFFPKSAWAYATSGWIPAKAVARWTVTDRNPHAEGADPAYRLALRGRPDPMGAGFPAFDACARGVLEPLLRHFREAR